MKSCRKQFESGQAITNGGGLKKCCLLAHFGDTLSGNRYHIHGKRVYKCNNHYRVRASLESGPVLAGPTGPVPPALAWPGHKAPK